MSVNSLQGMLPLDLRQLSVEPLFVFQLQVARASVIGMTPACDRRVGEITGGTFEGERLRGKLLPGGSDWQTVRSDGCWTLDVRVVMETDDGHLIGMTYKGMRHGPPEVMDRIASGDTTVRASDYYSRAAPVLRDVVREVRLDEPHHQRCRGAPPADRADLSGVRGDVRGRRSPERSDSRMRRAARSAPAILHPDEIKAIKVLNHRKVSILIELIGLNVRPPWRRPRPSCHPCSLDIETAGLFQNP